MFSVRYTYVACSRGRQSCTIHTPDKVRLMERSPEGNRRAALDVLRVPCGWSEQYHQGRSATARPLTLSKNARGVNFAGSQLVFPGLPGMHASIGLCKEPAMKQFDSLLLLVLRDGGWRN